MAENRFRDAFTKAQQAAALRPDVAEYHIGAGMAGVQIGEIEAAARHYSAAETILSTQAARDAERVDDHMVAVVLSGRPEEARQILMDGLKRFPDSDTLRKLAAADRAFLAGLRPYVIPIVASSATQNAGPAAGDGSETAEQTKAGNPLLPIEQAIAIAEAAIKEDVRFKDMFVTSARIMLISERSSLLQKHPLPTDTRTFWRIAFSVHHPAPPGALYFVEVTHEGEAFPRSLGR